MKYFVSKRKSKFYFEENFIHMKFIKIRFINFRLKMKSYIWEINDFIKYKYILIILRISK